MSTSPSSLPERSLGGAPLSRPRLICISTAEVPRAKKVPDIRRQALDIIETLLAMSDPDGSRDRDRLRALVEAHPGQPEVALAKHLLALRPSLDGPGAGVP